MDAASSSRLEKQREKYRARLDAALEEEEDPLAAYHEFVKWTIDNYQQRLIARSGLLELLEEATRRFKDDSAYKSDLRYLKLWSLFASHVEDPTSIYDFLLTNDIGKIYAQVYEDYAAALEANGRCVVYTIVGRSPLKAGQTNRCRQDIPTRNTTACTTT